MKSIHFYIQGIPKGQPRPRAFTRVVNGKTVARVYDSGTAENWKSRIAEAAKPWIDQPITLPVSIQLTFYMPRPKAHRNSKGKIKPSAPFYPAKKPDADNLTKAVMDALSELGMWRDDAQVVDCWTRKRYVTTAIAPGCEVRIMELPELTPVTQADGQMEFDGR